MNFKVGLSADLNNGKGGFTWGDVNIDSLSPLPWEFISQSEPNFTPDMVRNYDAIAFGAPGVLPGSFGKPEESPLIIARFGVGYDNIDLAECTRAGIALTITPDGSQKPVATAALTLMLATMHRLNAKGIVARENRWGDRLDKLGISPNGKTIATIGLGNIASEFFRLLAPFECERIAFDPWKSQVEADKFKVRLVSFEELLNSADVIVVMATLTPETRHLLNAKAFAAMKPSAIVVNISRGAIIEESALIDALQQAKIFGAGLDVFEFEPTQPDNPLLTMENVVVTPHNIAWTDELAFGMGSSAFASIKQISKGQIPKFVVNKEVLETDQFRKKLERWR